MKEKITSIGNLIKSEVSKQKISVTDFAEKICCKRNNVYDIFKRSDISLLQLKQISEVLQRNFFQEIANDLSIVSTEELTSADERKSKVYAELLECVPIALRPLERDTAIIIPEPIPDMDFLPDVCLMNYYITFTVDEYLKDRIKESELLICKSLTNKSGQEIEICTNRLYGTILINIKVEHRTQEEWNDVMKFAFTMHDKYYSNERFNQ